VSFECHCCVLINIVLVFVNLIHQPLVTYYCVEGEVISIHSSESVRAVDAKLQHTDYRFCKSGSVNLTVLLFARRLGLCILSIFEECNFIL